MELAEARKEQEKEMVLSFTEESVGIATANHRAESAIKDHAQTQVQELKRNCVIWLTRLVLCFLLAAIL